MLLKDKLLHLGFTPNQASVYVALLEQGQAKIGPLAEQTGLHRYIVYQALQDLLARKLVVKLSKRGVAYYSAADPEPLVHEFGRKEKLAADTAHEIRSQGRTSPAEALVLTGRQGIVDLYEMMLQTGEDIYLIGANFTIVGRYRDSMQEMERRVKARQTKYHILVQAGAAVAPPRGIKMAIRHLPRSFAPSPHVIWVTGDIVANVLWEQPELIFVIKNKKIADSYRQYFRVLWSRSR